MYYGVTGTESAALAELGSAGASTYALSKPNPADTGLPDGAPGVSYLGFSDLPCSVVTPVSTPAPVPVNRPFMLLVLATLLLAAGLRHQRR